MLCSYSIFPLTDSKKRLTESYFFIENVNKQVCSYNDASEVGILGHFGTFWNNSEKFEFGPFRLFSQSFPTIFIHYRLI